MFSARVTLFLILAILLSLIVFAQAQSVTTTVTHENPSVVVEPETPNVVVTHEASPVVVEKRQIITTAPAAKEVVTTPAGYVNCFTVDAGWYQDTWVPKHRICQYQNNPGKVAWVEGYWACNTYKPDGSCTNWEWRPGHWSSTLTVY